MVDHLLWLGVVCDARCWSFLVLEKFIEIVHQTNVEMRPKMHIETHLDMHHAMRFEKREMRLAKLLQNRLQ